MKKDVKNETTGKLPLDEKRTRKLINAIIESSYDGIYVTDGNANTLIVNRSYERISGLDRKQLIGKNMKDLVKESVINVSGTIKAIQSGFPVTVEQVFQTGNRAIITSTPIFNKAGEVVLVTTNVRDITELHDLRTKLRDTESEYEKNSFEVNALRRRLSRGDMIVRDGAMLSVIRMAGRVSKLSTTVTLIGEAGVGKDTVASYIHRESNRSRERFFKINCTAIPDALGPGELFGYAGNGKSSMGMIEVADKGTLLLDNVEELPLGMQRRLLKLLQKGEIRREGGREIKRVDVRIIAATSADLAGLVAAKKFMSELYYQLNVFPIQIPPLRERRADILPLANHFLDLFNQKYGMHVRFAEDTHDILLGYSWPGNVRELSNVVERSVIMNSSGEIMEGELSPLLKNTNTPQRGGVDINLKTVVQQLEMDYITQAYQKYGNVRDAARSLGMDAATFVRKRKKYTKD